MLNNVPYDALLALVLCCVFLFIALIIWIFFGRDDEIIEVKEFYPPDDLNCVDLAYIYKGAVERKDIVPLLLGLAQKGYLSLEQHDQKGRQYAIRLLKPYDGNDAAESMFMHGLAEYGSFIGKNELTASFYRTLDAIIIATRKKLKDKVFYKSTLILRNITWLFAIIPYFVGLFPTLKSYYGSSLFALILPVGTFLTVSVVTIAFASKSLSFFKKIIFIIAGPAALAVLLKFFGTALTASGIIWWIVYWSCAVANVFQTIFLLIIDKRKEYGIEMLGRVMGYKQYLEEATPAQLDKNVREDPEYFYKNLSYVYEFGVSRKWFKKFDEISMKIPDWYMRYRNGAYSYKNFADFVAFTMADVTVAMTSTPNKNLNNQ
ncbi:MAG: DUF2207 domain-containing protein [Eubacterium sp.]|nr:DUF2207 domain-containing protein [Eubacterium sp.]